MLLGSDELRGDGNGPSASEYDLTITGAAQAAWHQQAAEATRLRFGREVFVRAVVEVSNFCRENCALLYVMRRDNRSLSRYRAHHEQLAELLIHHRPASVTDVNIQSGEDPVAIREVVLPLIKALRRSTPLGISVCLGTLTPELYLELQQAGATIYIMKFECADDSRYTKVMAPGRLEERLEHIRLLAAMGWKVSSGFIAGLPGQEVDELAAALELARDLPLDGCSVSPFIPGESTPLSTGTPANPDWTFNCMAALRLMRPHWVIPAVSALNLAQKNGYQRGLRAGANLTTINLTPDDVRGDYVIYKRDRFIMTETRVLEAIANEGLPCRHAGVCRTTTAKYWPGGKKRLPPCRPDANCVLYPCPKKNGTPGRVVITGAGIVTALGIGWRKNADGFRAGRTAFRRVTQFDVSRQRAQNAAEVDLPPDGLPVKLSRHALRRLTRSAAMLLLATHEAWKQSGWEASDDLPLVLGTTSGAMSLGEAYLRQALESPGANRHQPTRVVHYQMQREALNLCDVFGFPCGPDNHRRQCLRFGRECHRAGVGTVAQRTRRTGAHGRLRCPVPIDLFRL